MRRGEGDVEPSEAREKIEDLKQRYGYEEQEAEIAYHLREAYERFTKLLSNDVSEEGPLPEFSARLFMMSTVDPHFRALNSLLARGMLGRDYPEGWGSQPAREEEEQPE
jgi:hypothetical protein